MSALPPMGRCHLYPGRYARQCAISFESLFKEQANAGCWMKPSLFFCLSPIHTLSNSASYSHSISRGGESNKMKYKPVQTSSTSFFQVPILTSTDSPVVHWQPSHMRSGCHPHTSILWSVHHIAMITSLGNYMDIRVLEMSGRWYLCHGFREPLGFLIFVDFWQTFEEAVCTWNVDLPVFCTYFP